MLIDKKDGQLNDLNQTSACLKQECDVLKSRLSTRRARLSASYNHQNSVAEELKGLDQDSKNKLETLNGEFQQSLTNLDSEREFSSDMITKLKNELNDMHAKNNEMCAIKDDALKEVNALTVDNDSTKE